MLIKNSIAACCRPSWRFCSKCFAPLTHRCVHGGKAIIISQDSRSSGVTSCCKCHSGWFPLVGSMSQEYALCPFPLNASVTIPDSSHATRIFTLSTSRTCRQASRNRRSVRILYTRISVRPICSCSCVRTSRISFQSLASPIVASAGHPATAPSSYIFKTRQHILVCFPPLLMLIRFFVAFPCPFTPKPDYA